MAVKVSDLKPATKGLNLLVKIIQTKMIAEQVREDGTASRVAEVVVGDETGCILMAVKNDNVLQPGTAIDVRNAEVRMFRGTMRLVVDRQGSVGKAQEGFSQFVVNEKNNLSLMQYELVTLFNATQVAT